MRYPTLMIAIALAVCTAGGQEPERGSVETLIQESKAAYSMQKDFILAAADKMPEANYSFKPTPEVRSYGALFTHIVQVQNAACAIIAGQIPSRPTGASPTT